MVVRLASLEPTRSDPEEGAFEGLVGLERSPRTRSGGEAVAPVIGRESTRFEQGAGGSVVRVVGWEPTRTSTPPEAVPPAGRLPGLDRGR